jgi:hypothetical protein
MTFTPVALLLPGIIGITLLLGSVHAVAESASCQAQLKQQDEQCQALAEKLAEACPSGTDIKETALCRELSNQIASTCTRRPCGPPPRKAKRKGKKSGMGMRSKKATPTKQ